MIEAALVALLKADEGVAAIVGTRIYPAPAPESATLPNVTWQQITDTPTRVAEGVLNYRQSRYQVNVWAASTLVAINAANAMRAAIDAWTQEDAVFMAVTENVTDLFDGSFAPPRWGRALDIRVVHKE